MKAKKFVDKLVTILDGLDEDQFSSVQGLLERDFAIEFEDEEDLRHSDWSVMDSDDFKDVLSSVKQFLETVA